jgi:hypothetical protein
VDTLELSGSLVFDQLCKQPLIGIFSKKKEQQRTGNRRPQQAAKTKTTASPGQPGRHLQAYVNSKSVKMNKLNELSLLVGKQDN